ncbi:MAG: hypothetical protein HY996_12495 [Micrococcales bacterium]|nr:hypothetical protein [Micrococcales bacterium]
MVRPAAFGLFVLLAACTIDSSKLDDLECAGSCDAPDLECVDGYCVARGCGDFRDCGETYQYVCEEQMCRAIECIQDGNCAGGYVCSDDGFCAVEQCGEQEDVDGDGYTAVACGGPDCDDDDPDVSPGAVEGAVGGNHPSCDDLIDNDCDGRADASDEGCAPCTDDTQCEDGNPCTQNTCRRGACLAEPLDGAACDDGDPCTSGDVCDIVVCGGTAYSCDDGFDCTDDVCDGAGGCDNPVSDGSCLVDGECLDDGQASADEPCLVCMAAQATDALTALADGTVCDDGEDCTSSDVCAIGTCGGAEYACDDGLACTTDACDGLGGCEVAVAEGQCAIDGACWAAGDPRPGNVCQACDPDADPSVWTADAAANPDDALACTTDACVDDVETHTPNDGACGVAGQICAPCAGTADGCATPPSSLTVTCPASAALGGLGAACTLAVVGAVGADACLSCEASLGVTTLVREDFAGCPALGGRGWTVAGAPACPTDAGLPPAPGSASDALESEQSSFTLTRRFDTTGLDHVRLCFDAADRAAGANDTIEVRIDSDGSFDAIHTLIGGPVAGVDDLWVTTCLALEDLEPAAADNPDLGVRFAVATSGADDNVYLDSIVLEGWRAGAITSAPIATTDFAACALGAWTPSGDAVECPVAGGALVGREAIAAETAVWSLAQDVDASAVCEDLTLEFQLAAENALAADTTLVSYDAGAGSLAAWGSLGQPDAAGTLRTIVVNLSHRDPDLRFSPAVGLELDVVAATAGARLGIDDLTVSGATCAPGTGVVTAAAPAPAGGGSYDVAVTANARTRAYVACGWGGRPATGDRAAIDFGP